MHCTCRAVRAYSWGETSTSGGGQACQSAVYGGGRASGGRSRYWEYVDTRSILTEHNGVTVRHRLHWCWHHWAFYIGCDSAGGVACQEGHNLQVRSLDTETKNRHATGDDVSHYTLGNLQAMLLKLVCNTWSYHLHRERRNTRSQLRYFVYRWVAGLTSRVLLSAPLSAFAAAHPAASEEYWGYWLAWAGVRPLQRCALRATAGSPNIDCQLSYIQATLSRCRQYSRDAFRRTWRSWEPKYPPVWGLP